MIKRHRNNERTKTGNDLCPIDEKQRKGLNIKRSMTWHDIGYTRIMQTILALKTATTETYTYSIQWRGKTSKTFVSSRDMKWQWIIAPLITALITVTKVEIKISSIDYHTFFFVLIDLTQRFILLTLLFQSPTLTIYIFFHLR